MKIDAKSELMVSWELRITGVAFLPPPIIRDSVVCTKLMSWMKEGTPEMGMKVKAVFNTDAPTNTILDLAWVPA